MAELSAKRAASLKATARRLKQTSDAGLSHIHRAIEKGWDQFDRQLVNVIYARRASADDQLTVSGLLLDVGIAFLLGPLAGALASEVAERFLRPSVRSRLTFAQPIATAPRRKIPIAYSSDIEAQLDKVVKADPLDLSVSLRQTLPEFDDYWLQDPAARLAQQQSRVIDYLDRKFFDARNQTIEKADTAAFRMMNAQWVGDAVSEVASDEAREAREQRSRRGSKPLSAEAERTLAEPDESDFLATVQVKDQFNKFLNEQRDVNQAILIETEGLIDAAAYTEELGTTLESAYEHLLEDEPDETSREKAINKQARAFEAMLWVLWFIEITGKQLKLDAKGRMFRNLTSATGAVADVSQFGEVTWKVERALVDYWVTNLVDPSDSRGRTFLEIYKEPGYKEQTAPATKEALRRAENWLQAHFFNIEREITKMNTTGEKLLSIVQQTSPAPKK